MIPLELVIVIVLMGAVYLVVGIFVGWQGRKYAESPRQQQDEAAIALAELRKALVANAQENLSARLTTLVSLREQIAATSDTDLRHWREKLRALIEEVIETVRQSQQLIGATGAKLGGGQPAAGASGTDAAGLVNESWFPSKTAPSAQENRRTRRFPFRRVQRIAAVHGQQLPEPSSYFEVRFHDISTGGFSFFISDRLECEQIVAELGAPPRTVSVLARVLHQREVDSAEGPRYLVGCEILKRLEPLSPEEPSGTR